MKISDVVAHINVQISTMQNKYAIIAWNRIKKLLQSLPEKSLTAAVIDKLDVTPSMKEKLKAIITKPIIKKDDTQQLVQSLGNIPGMTVIAIKNLINAGLSRIKQLNSKKWEHLIPDMAKMYIKYNPQPIKHEKITQFKNYLLELKLPIQWLFVGSYRRKRPISTDVDMMIVRDAAISLQKVIDFMVTHGIKLHIYAKGSDKVSTIVDTKGFPSFKLDIFRTPKNEMYPMLLYRTGSASHNIMMRSVAKRKHYLLNQKGLYKVTPQGNTLIPTNSEESIFKALDIAYVEPEFREINKS